MDDSDRDQITIKDGKLHKDGKDLKLRGINYADAFYTGALTDKSRWKILDSILSTNFHDKKTPRINAIRAFIFLDRRRYYHKWDITNNEKREWGGIVGRSGWFSSFADIKALIANCKRSGVNVVLAAADISLGDSKIRESIEDTQYVPYTMEVAAKNWVKLYNGVVPNNEEKSDLKNEPRRENSPLIETEGNVMINLGNEPIVPLNADTWETDWTEQMQKVDSLRWPMKLKLKLEAEDATRGDIAQENVGPALEKVKATLKELEEELKKKSDTLQDEELLKLQIRTDSALKKVEAALKLLKLQNVVLTNAMLIKVLNTAALDEAEELVLKLANMEIEKLLTTDWGVWKAQMIRAMNILNNGFNEGGHKYERIPHHIIVVDGPSYSGKPLKLDEDGQTTIDAWKEVIEERSDKVMASLHMYDYFQTKERVNSTLDAYLKSNIPVMVGEFGLHKINEGDQETIIRIDAHAIMKKCEDEGIPYLAWSWVTGFNQDGEGQYDDGTAMMKHPGLGQDRLLVNYPPSWPNDKKERASDLHTNFGLTVLAQMHQGELIDHKWYGWSYKLQRWSTSRFILKGEDGKYVEKATPEELKKDFVRLKPNQTLVWKVPGFVDHEQYMRLNYRAASKVRIDFDGSWNRDSYFVIEPTFYDNKLDWSRMDRGQSWIKRKLKNNAPLPLKERPPVWNEVYITNISDPSSVTTVSSLDGPPGEGEIDIKELYVNYWKPN